MNQKINKYLTEAMGLCWHIKSKCLFIAKKEDYSAYYLCECGTKFISLDESYHNPDFSTWQGFGTLWEWAIKQEWWYAFGIYWLGLHNIVDVGQMTIFLSKQLNPEKFANAIYGFLKEGLNEN